MEVSELKYKQFIEEGPDVFWSADLDGYFTYVSPQFEQMFAYTFANTIGRSCFDFVHPSDKEELLASIRRLREGYTPVSYTHLTLPTTPYV